MGKGELHKHSAVKKDQKRSVKHKNISKKDFDHHKRAKLQKRIEKVKEGKA